MGKHEELQRAADRLDIHRVDFQPIIRGYMQRLGLVELINRMVVTEMEVEPGLILAGMVQDTFSGRSPLYHLESFFADQDTELLLGTAPEPGTFSDHNVGRTLDRIYRAGPSRIFSEIGRRAAIAFDLDTRSGHWDSTSVSVWGDYDVYAGQDDQRLRLTFGYSKDHRPDLKQFLISMLCVEHNIPILGDTHDGNSADKTLNNRLLTRISQDLARDGLAEGAFTYTADAALVQRENLACFNARPGTPPLYFVTRLPFSYKEADRVVAEAVHANRWEHIGVLAKSRSTPKRPSASYRAYNAQVELYGHSYRAIVVHSSADDKRRRKRLERELREAHEQLAAALKPTAKTEFYCRADAEAELARLQALRSTYYRVEGQVEERLKYGPGRPPRNRPRPVKSRRWAVQSRIVERPDAVRRKRAEAGCFVLLTNRPATGPDAQTAEELLRTYKAQDGIERNFSFLKDPLIVNDLFLKKPERIEALGMVLLTCLLIWNLMQRQMRRYLEQTATTIEGWDRRPTDRPTSYMMTTKFRGILVLKHGDARVVKPALSPVRLRYLTALGLTPQVFTNPRAPPL